MLAVVLALVAASVEDLVTSGLLPLAELPLARACVLAYLQKTLKKKSVVFHLR